MDVKKIVFGIVAVAIAAYFLIPPDGVRPGSKAEMTINFAPTNQSADIKGVTMILDNSGSMKGYVDFAGYPEGKGTMISEYSGVITNIKSKTGVSADVICGGSNYNQQTFLDGMNNMSIFRGATTELESLTRDAVKVADDTTVSIVASDMILSAGLQRINFSNDPYYNRHHLEQLAAALHSEISDLKTKGLDLIVVMYKSDFNGKYYYNETENKVNGNAFRQTLMKDRPYYLLMLGTQRNLEYIIENTLTGSETAIFTSFVCNGSQTSSFKINANKHWSVGTLPDGMVTIYSPNDLQGNAYTFNISCDPIQMPKYVPANACQAQITKGQSLTDVSVSSDYSNWTIGTKTYDQMVSEECEVTLVVDWANSYASIGVDDDTQGDAAALEGKTWGMGTVMDNLFKAYNKPASSVLISIPFNIMKDTDYKKLKN